MIMSTDELARLWVENQNYLDTLRAIMDAAYGSYKNAPDGHFVNETVAMMREALVACDAFFAASDRAWESLGGRRVEDAGAIVSQVEGLDELYRKADELTKAAMKRIKP